MYKYKRNAADLELIRGDSLNLALTITNTNDNAEPFAFTEGDLATFTVRQNAKSRVLIKKEYKDLTGNVLEINVDPEETEELEAGIYVYDVEIRFKDGRVKTIIPPAEIKVIQDVTYV